MSFTPQFLVARDLPDAWFQAVDLVLSEGRQWAVEHGSYEGQQRWELDYITIRITNPGVRPLIPEIPIGMDVPPPTTMEYVEEYLPYLMTDQPPQQNEVYTYGERVAPQMEAIIRRYLEHGFGSNQECIAVARPSDIELGDPPCLRQIDCRVFPEECLEKGEEQALHFSVYFRSNDLWGGFPANLAAIRLMQEYMAESLGIAAGEIIYSSKGLHIYDHAWSVARLRTARAKHIKVGDLKISYYRQMSLVNVNATACCVVHIPTGIETFSSEAATKFHNKQMAMTLLKLELDKRGH